MNEKHCTIVAYPTRVAWSIQTAEDMIASGSEPLTSTNGDYDALMSNVLNNVNQYNVDHFLYRKG